MKHGRKTKAEHVCNRSYKSLESALREQFTQTSLSYREIAAVVGWSHTQLWLFHKQQCKLQFDVLNCLANFFKVPYQIEFVPNIKTGETCYSITELPAVTRAALDKALEQGVSYRKVSEKTGISHEWIRCFHIKEANIEARKLMILAEHLAVAYELSNADSLAEGRLS